VGLSGPDPADGYFDISERRAQGGRPRGAGPGWRGTAREPSVYANSLVLLSYAR